MYLLLILGNIHVPRITLHIGIQFANAGRHLLVSHWYSHETRCIYQICWRRDEL